MKQLENFWKDFMKVDTRLSKMCRTFDFWLKSYTNNFPFTWNRTRVSARISSLAALRICGSEMCFEQMLYGKKKYVYYGQYSSKVWRFSG
jgi:hypothetical protein